MKSKKKADSIKNQQTTLESPKSYSRNSENRDENNKKGTTIQTSPGHMRQQSCEYKVSTNITTGDKIDVLRIPLNEYRFKLYENSLIEAPQNEIFISGYRQKIYDKNFIMNKQRVIFNKKRTHDQLKAEHLEIFYPKSIDQSYSIFVQKQYREFPEISEKSVIVEQQKEFPNEPSKVDKSDESKETKNLSNNKAITYNQQKIFSISLSLKNKKFSKTTHLSQQSEFVSKKNELPLKKSEEIVNNENKISNKNIFSIHKAKTLESKKLIFSSNFYIHDIFIDGNCFFRCISLFLTGTQNYFSEIRQTISKYVEKHIEEYQNLIFEVDGFPVNGKDYAEMIYNNGFCSGNLEIIITSFLYNLIINIYFHKKINFSLQRTHEVNLREKGKQTVNLLFVGNNHYKLLTTKEEISFVDIEKYQICNKLYNTQLDLERYLTVGNNNQYKIRGTLPPYPFKRKFDITYQDIIYVLLNKHTKDRNKIYPATLKLGIEGVTSKYRKAFKKKCLRSYEIDQNKFILYYLSRNKANENIKQQVLTTESIEVYLEEAHRKVGHSEINQILKYFRKKKISWPEMTTNIIEYIKKCPFCAKIKSKKFKKLFIPKIVEKWKAPPPSISGYNPQISIQNDFSCF